METLASRAGVNAAVLRVMYSRGARVAALALGGKISFFICFHILINNRYLEYSAHSGSTWAKGGDFI